MTLAIVGPTFASKPDKAPLPPGTYVVPAGQMCSFEVLWQPLTNKEKIMTFYDRNGNVVRRWVSGQSTTRLTNTATGKSLDLNTSGPGPATFENGFLVIGGRGNGLVGLYAGDAGGPGLWATKGPWQLVIDPATGQILQSDLPRNRTDMCAVLAAA